MVSHGGRPPADHRLPIADHRGVPAHEALGARPNETASALRAVQHSIALLTWAQVASLQARIFGTHHPSSIRDNLMFIVYRNILALLLTSRNAALLYSLVVALRFSRKGRVPTAWHGGTTRPISSSSSA